LIALVLCLALPGFSWAAMPVDQPPVGSLNSPRALQQVTWSGFTPSGWVTSLPVACSIQAYSAGGFVGIGDAYSISTDGGANWSGWLTEGLSTNVLGADTRIITVTGLPFGDSETQNWIRFRTYETGNLEATSDPNLVKVDVTGPGAPQELVALPPGWTNTASFSVEWKNPQDLTPVVAAWYKLNSAPTSAADGTRVVTTTSISGISPAVDGAIPVYVWLEDAHGRTGYITSASTILRLDTTPPVSSETVTPPAAASGWYTTSVNIQFVATDLPEDPAYPPYVYTSLDGGAWTPVTQMNVGVEGVHSLLFQARDKVNNIESTKTIALKIDMTPPTVSLVPGRQPNASGWYTASVPYAINVVDSGSGPYQSYYRLNSGAWQLGTSFTLATEGIHQIEAYGTDVAGNRSATATRTARVDMTAPVTAWSKVGTLGTNDWYVSDVTVQLLPVDTVSGVGLTRYRINETAWQTGLQFPMAADGTYNVSFASVDVAGNAELPVNGSLKIDTTAPGAPTSVQVVPSTWTNINSFDVTWTPPDDLSGIDGAYYKLGEAPTGPRDGIPITGTNQIDDLVVPAEGAHSLYLWMRDGAGNTDHTTAPAQGPLLRYDATAPVTTMSVTGTLGMNDWYRSPVTVTLTATDGTSGVSALYYRMSEGEWQLVPTGSVSIACSEAGIYSFEYYAEDAAGNQETGTTRTVKVDFAPPLASQVSVTPAQGSTTNSFRLEWPLVEDVSGVAGAYVRFDSPPSGPTDGTYYAGAAAVDGVVTPGEGRHTAYVWLIDAAGNADHFSAVVLEDGLCYDMTPPVTEITLTGNAGLNGWYVGPVTFAMSATDAVSGVREIRHRIDEGPWAAAEQFVFDEEGGHTVEISAVDNVGNEEDPGENVYDVAIDRTPPYAALVALGSMQLEQVFEVGWSGTDGANGSGLASYDVEVRDGYDAPWGTWLHATSLTTSHFHGQRGHTYFFRVFARDLAGNRQEASSVTRVLVQPVLNGGFETANFDHWTWSGELLGAVKKTEGPYGQEVFAAHLGWEDWGPSLTPPGLVPADSATISQVLFIPPLSQVRWPALTFWYRVKTYDVMYSTYFSRFVDTFDVTLNTVAGEEIALLLRDGNPDSSKWGSLYDTGWKFAMIDLRPYAGQMVKLSFANWNRHDNMFNTWSYVDDIRLIDRSRVYAPFVFNSEAFAAAAADEPAQGSEPLALDRKDPVR